MTGRGFDVQHRTEPLEALLRRAASGQVGRRAVLAGLAALGLPVLPAAAGGEFVIANWGGPAADAFMKVWGPVLQEKLGLTLAVDGSGPTTGKIRSQVEAHKVNWDVCDASVGAALLLGQNDLAEEIDYAIVDRSKVRPGYAYKWAICNYIFSYVLAYDRKALGGRAPANWKDFWNVKDFPGKRTLRGSCIGQLECALLADGVPASQIYPIDLRRALEKIREIREHTIFWKSGSQSEDLLRNGDVVMGNLWHNRTNLLRVESKGNITWTWEGAVVAPAVWVVPKGNPAGREAGMRFIEASLDPAAQVELFRTIYMGPSNPAAAAMVPADLRPYDPGQPENFARQIPLNEDWYAQNLTEAEAKYLDVIS